LWAFPRAEWEQLAERIRALPATNRATRGFVRFIFSDAYDSIPDRQGRVLIPQKLREHAGITGETAVIGVMNRVEIWNPDRWSEAFSRIEQDLDEIIAQLEELGINI
jgi:MraZ protein